MINTYLCYYASNPPSYPKQLCGKCNHFEKCFDFLFKKKNMETKEVKIEIPEGYEIDESKSSFEKIVFKKKDGLPKTWDEFNENRIRCGFVSADVPFEYGNSFWALSKLIELRDCYNDGWKPDYNNHFQQKFTVFHNGRTLNVLSFKSQELRNMFVGNFSNLIDVAKDLL